MSIKTFYTVSRHKIAHKHSTYIERCRISVGSASLKLIRNIYRNYTIISRVLIYHKNAFNLFMFLWVFQFTVYRHNLYYNIQNIKHCPTLM